MRFPSRYGAILTLACAAALALPAHAQQTSLNELLTRWDRDEHPDLRSVLVMKNGVIVAERYYNGETADTLHDVRSAGKSITALLAGAAVDRGSIRAVSDKVEQYWPAAKGSAIGDVAVDDILTMRSGLASFDEDPASPGNEDKLDDAPDPLAFALSIPRATAPGTLYRYNSLTAYIAGVLVEKATGSDLEDFARTALFGPLAIAHWQWGRDVAGHPKGQGNLSLRTRDFAKIGQLVLAKGIYQGRAVISAAWIAAATTPRAAIGGSDPYADSYGYFWYAKTHAVDGKQVPVLFASGNGGNKIYVVPSLRMVVAVTSSAYGKGYGQRRSQDILKAILAAEVKH